jgi:outer membrane receptor protein involved in Fe transport
MYAKAATRVGPQVQEMPTGEKLYQWSFLQSSTEVAQVGWSQTWTPVFRTQLKLNRSHLTPLSVSAMAVVPGSPVSAGTVPYLQSLDPGLNSNYDMLDTTIDQAVLQANWDPSEALHFVFGLDSARMKALKAPIVGAPADSQDSAAGGFASMDWIQGPATLSLGARVENETLGGSRISPRAALVYVLPEGSVFRAGYFTSTRSPSVFEVKQALPPIPGRPAPIGNPDVKPEKFDNFEIGFRKNFARWSLDFTAYQMNLKKVIGPEPTGVIVGGFPQTQFRNSTTSLVNKGLEVSAKGELALGWLLGFNAAAVDFQDALGIQQSYSSKLKANLWTRYQYRDLQAYVALQHTGAYAITNAEDFAGPREDAPARLQVHFNLSYAWNHHFMVSIYGVNAARASEESTAGSTNNNYLIRFARREMGLQASYRF